jgi:hypothetical protein
LIPNTKPAPDPFEATTDGEERAPRRAVDHFIDLEPGADGFASILVDGWRDKRSGMLRLQSARGLTSIYLNHGTPVYAESTDPEAFFGRMLVRLGRITDAELQRAVNACGRSKVDQVRFAEVLVEAKLVDHQAVYELFLLHVCDLILSCFGADKLRARFVPGRSPPLEFPFSTPSLLREGVDRSFDQERVDRIVAPWVNQCVRLRRNVDFFLEQLGLTPEEHAFLCKLDGSEPLGVTSQRGHLPPLQTTKLVAVLVLLDLIRPVAAADPGFAARRRASDR